jgi:hypothetical protein
MWLNPDRANLLLELLSPIVKSETIQPKNYSANEKKAAEQMIKYANNYLKTGKQED